MIENLDDFIKELSLELKKLFKVKDMVQSRLKKERKKHPGAMNVINDVQSWFIHVDKSIKLGNRLLGPKFPMKFLLWSDPQRNRDASDKKKDILKLIKTFLELKNQAQDLLDRIARHSINAELRQLKVQTFYFSLKEIKVATDNFDPKNEIGVGGFGPIYKGVLQDGTIVAVKRLSTNSMQGERVIVNEIAMLSTLQHRNIVKLFGCCIEGSELLIIYEYLENASLDRALFGPESSRLKLDWQRRRKISFDIARGLAYLHEESRQTIVHGDIKASNILLDKNLNAKISGFYLAILDDEENTHISTSIAGTYGYIAPEYVMRGHLTEKADVYNYGIVLLEIVGGKCNTKYRSTEDLFRLLNCARFLKDRGKLLDLMDPTMGSNFSVTEVEQMLNLALVCTNDDPSLRPTMSSVVSMIGGGTMVTVPSMEIGGEKQITFSSSSFRAMEDLDGAITTKELLKQLKVQTSYFSFKQIKVATDNFNEEIGQDSFGCVYKGVLQDGTIVAVKQLYRNSSHGKHEFVNEIGILSVMQHRNIVKLLGCCIEGSELLIIYEFMENISLHRALFGPKRSRLKLDWQRRHKISFDIARGLAYLHEESRQKIVHRNIKVSNILLDKNLEAKVCGFHLAILDDEENTHIAGTFGYLAPEYAMSGHLTEKADVYSYGVVLLEIISGKRCISQNPKNGPEDFVYLLDWARRLKDQGKLLDLVDPCLGSNFFVIEAEQMLNLALLCTNGNPTVRPTMSSVVNMIEGRTPLMDPSMDRFDS